MYSRFYRPVMIHRFPKKHHSPCVDDTSCHVLPRLQVRQVVCRGAVNLCRSCLITIAILKYFEEIDIYIYGGFLKWCTQTYFDKISWTVWHFEMGYPNRDTSVFFSKRIDWQFSKTGIYGGFWHFKMGYPNRDISVFFFLTDRQFFKTGIYGGFLKCCTQTCFDEIS
jgi:hypothetical protein